MNKATVKKKRPVFGLKMKSADALYKAYMPFLENGGLFIPTMKVLTLGQVVGLRITLPQSDDEYKIKGRVAWITPESAQSRWKPGIGIQFLGEEAQLIRTKIEGLLAGKLQSDKPTNTL